MNKRDVVSFIEIQRQQKLDEVEDKWNELIKQEKFNIMKNGGYDKRIEVLQMKVNNLSMEMSKIINDMTQDRHTCYNSYSYNNLLSKLNSYSGSEIVFKELMGNCSFLESKVDSLKDKKEREIASVKANYAKVLAVIKNKKGAKACIEYLEGIGFNMAAFKKEMEPMALIVEIDKSKLFCTHTGAQAC